MAKGRRAGGEAERRRRAAARRPAPAPPVDEDSWVVAAVEQGMTIEQARAARRGAYVLARERAATPVNGADRDARERLRRVGLDLERVRAREAVLWERAAPLVHELRAQGVSWRHVGDSLGISHVAARKRFG